MQNSKILNIVILAAGPPKPARNRHLEKFNGIPLIDNVINACNTRDAHLYVVIDNKNKVLYEHLQQKECIKQVLTVSDQEIYTTFKTAMSIPGDCILVCGDLINVSAKDINKFIETRFPCAISYYPKHKWGPNLNSAKKNIVRRSDIGDCISKISEKHKEEFLSKENYRNAQEYFSAFYPNKTMNKNVYNDIGTHLMYAFFFDIWSSKNINVSEQKGIVEFDHRIWQDND